jgi:hypothetical protein
MNATLAIGRLLSGIYTSAISTRRSVARNAERYLVRGSPSSLSTSDLRSVTGVHLAAEVSGAEDLGLWFEAANRTTFIGSPTNGTDGDVTFIVLPGRTDRTFYWAGGTTRGWPAARTYRTCAAHPDSADDRRDSRGPGRSHRPCTGLRPSTSLKRRGRIDSRRTPCRDGAREDRND